MEDHYTPTVLGQKLVVWQLYGNVLRLVFENGHTLIVRGDFEFIEPDETEEVEG